MKTTHQFARELLAGPDVPVIVYSQGDRGELPPCAEPQGTLGEGYDSPDGGELTTFVEIHAICDRPSMAEGESINEYVATEASERTARAGGVAS